MSTNAMQSLKALFNILPRYRFYDFFFGDENIKARPVSCFPQLLLRNDGADRFLIDSAETFVPLVFLSFCPHVKKE